MMCPSWRSIGEELPVQLNPQQSHVLVDGRLHWLSLRGRYQVVRKLVSFDLADEPFREIPQPAGCDKFCRHQSHLVNIGGCLSAVVYHGCLRLEIYYERIRGEEILDEGIQHRNLNSTSACSKMLIHPSNFRRFITAEYMPECCALRRILRSCQSIDIEFWFLMIPDGERLRRLSFRVCQIGLKLMFTLHIGSLNSVDTLIDV
ncbi:hypothetical protein OIU77_011055 [Salix suchowensis]|uniref:F-box family protein n=1 Tax=Salix suchowensis TaxID=1278906 RepID=A0ABQ9AAM1_9ROSI|nr:hypothetical protein OIU77_011055 [Salix suchowensis]